MKFFDLKEETLRSFTPAVMSLLRSIEENKGRLFDLPSKAKLNRLHDLSKRRSVTSSNAIEGIKVSPKREGELLVEGADPSTKEDYQLLGYNDALTYVFENYLYVNVDEALVNKLHYLLYRKYNPAFGGHYKDTQNYIVEGGFNGKPLRTVFTPPSPEETPSLMGNLLWQFGECARDPLVDRLLLTFAFINDFLCLHPYNDGNGRTSRLLTTFLLLKFGYTVDLYYSISYLILERQDEYYRALQQSSARIYENKTDPSSFTEYMLSILSMGYERLAYLKELADMKGLAVEKVYRVVKEAMKPLTKADLEELLFFLSRTTIEKALADLVAEKKLVLVQKGHYAKYVVAPTF